jgi:uncharacterized protein (TIGR03437 family)
VRVDINDSGKVSSSGALYLASPSQVNFLVPSTVAVGRATVAASTATSTPQGLMLVSNVAPAVFAANGNGEGAAAAQLLQVPPSGAVTVSNTFEATGTGFGTTPLNLSPASNSFYLVLYATGIRRHSLNPVQASIGGVKVPVTYAGAVSGLAGLDQINVGPLPQSLAGTGKGDVDVVVTVDGVPANTVKVNVR